MMSTTAATLAPTLYCTSDADFGLPVRYLYCDNGVTYDARTGQAVNSSGRISQEQLQAILNAIGS